MDLVGYREGVRGHREEYLAFLDGIGAVSPRQFVPIAAFDGENLATAARRPALVRRPHLARPLDALRQGAAQGQSAAAHAGAGGLQVHERSATIAASSPAAIEAGRVAVGDKVVFSPSNKISTIRSIEGFNIAPRTSIEAGWSTGFTLTEEIYVTRGEVVSHVGKPPLVSTRVRANLIWLGKSPLTKGRDYKLKLGTAAVPVQLQKINKVIDARELDTPWKRISRPPRRRRRDPRAAAAGGVRHVVGLRGHGTVRDRGRLRRGRWWHRHRGGRRRPSRPAGGGAHPRLQLGTGRRAGS